jgi:hypothetical protein
MSMESHAAATSDTGKPSPLAQVFQEAYQKAVLIKRLDEQLAQIGARRKQLCDELRSIQSMLNDEFSRLVETGQAAGISPMTVAQPDFTSGNGVHVTVRPQSFTHHGAEAAVA